jgi:hypothetical protein
MIRRHAQIPSRISVSEHIPGAEIGSIGISRSRCCFATDGSIHEVRAFGSSRFKGSTGSYGLDVDFYDRALLFGAPPQVVHVAFGNCCNTRLFEVLADEWADIERALLYRSRQLAPRSNHVHLLVKADAYSLPSRHRHGVVRTENLCLT